MRRLMRAKDTVRSGQELPKSLPPIGLQHGQALWLLTELGFRGNASKSTFYEYIKSLRKFGTPFERGKIGFAGRGLAYYSYTHLMELALVLSLRVYYVVPDVVLAEVIRHRQRLQTYYRRAYAERCDGIGAPVTVQVDGPSAFEMWGAYLDLRMTFSGGTMSGFGPPQLVSPSEALRIFAARNIGAGAFLPVNLSSLAERLVATALQAPKIKRGPQSRTR